MTKRFHFKPLRHWIALIFFCLCADTSPARSVEIDGQPITRPASPSGTTGSLQRAVELGSIPSIESLRHAPSAKPKPEEDGDTLLHIAAERSLVNGTAVLQALLKVGLALDARDKAGRTPFMRAVKAHQWDAMTFLIRKGANINAIDRDGNTALHSIIAEQSDLAWHRLELTPFETWKKSWQLGKLTGPSFQQLVRWRILSSPSTQMTNSSITAWLLKNKADPNTTNRNGDTPLELLCNADWKKGRSNYYSYIALQTQATNRIALLLKAGAKLTPRAVAGENFFTTSYPVVYSLVKEPNTFRDKQGRTWLHWAVMDYFRMPYYEKPEAVSVLLTKGADVNAQDSEGRTPLHLALEINSTNIWSPTYMRTMLAILLKDGVQWNVRDKLGRTPLHIAALTHTDVLRDPAVREGADFSIRDSSGNTPLHNLVESRSSSPVHQSYEDTMLREILVNKGLLNLTNATGDTILHLAARGMNEFWSKTIIESGGDPSLRNSSGETSLRIAAIAIPHDYGNVFRPAGASHSFFNSIQTRDRESFELCLAADPTLCCVTNAQGQTPLQLATQWHLDYFSRRLVELGAK